MNINHSLTFYYEYFQCYAKERRPKWVSLDISLKVINVLPILIHPSSQHSFAEVRNVYF